MFLKSQRDFLSLFETIVANTLQTAVLYATSLGLNAEIGGPIDYSNTEENDKASQFGDGNTNWNEKLKLNKNLWEEELGLNSKKSPEELKKILGWNSNKVSISFIWNRSKDLVTGSNLKISKQVFKTNLKKNK